jgi:hypothetical protein
MGPVMRLWIGFALALSLAAQNRMPTGIVRGDMVSWQGSSTGGEIRIKNADDIIYDCQFDVRTYFERDLQRISVSGLRPGDAVEVVADRKPGSTACYARTVQVVDQHAQKLAPGVRPRLRTSPSPTEAWAPRGNLSIAGVVVNRAKYSLTLKTRNGTETLVLRPDTRYVGSGLRVDAEALNVNQRVFVRAGRNLDGDVEAYQVMWGEIVSPK